MYNRQELTQISASLVEPAERKQSLSLRLIVQVERSFMAFARAIGYKTIEGKGSARIRKAGSKSKDYEFVGEESSVKTQPTYDVDATISYTKDEVDEARAAAMMGRGPIIPIDQYRIRTAQRVVDEAIDGVGFLGAPDGEVKGLLTYDGIQKTETKKSFDTIKPIEMLKEFLRLRSIARNNGIFKPNVMVVPPRIMDLLSQPISEHNTQTIMQWMQTMGGIMPTVIETPSMDAALNGLGADAILMLDNNPAIVQLSLLKDLELTPPLQTGFDEWQMMVRSKTGGIILREPKAIALMIGV